ncbi:MAG TPA: Flp family type IVb pilin [Gemmataceae bacterium]|nr:Flp family type IVb pilin [Gemmataceae bacterium]
MKNTRLWTRPIRAVVSFLRREDGPTAVEYALLLGLIIGACFASISALGPAAADTFRSSTATVGTYGVP